MELFGSTSRGGFSVRGIFTFVLVVVVTALLWVIIGGEPAHAADANWSGESIIYEGHGFTKSTEYKDSSNAIPSGATVYQTPPQTDTATGSQKVFIIYFSPGVDPPLATTAKYVEFKYTAANGLTNPQNEKDITLTKQGEQSEFSSCSVGGIGWIVCPISVFFAEAMDNIFAILANMIQVQPSVFGDQNNSMYVAWNIMRNIANIAFVIVFLIIIYSQLTSLGVSNYGLKKLLPRLIIAAVLVNISYVVSAVAIDLSNILGFSIQDVFNQIREDTFHITNDNFSGVNDNAWTAVTTVILAGGGVIGGVYFLAAGSLYLLIPLLLGLLLTIIFVVVVLAARQAIIIILVIIAPLAFVANLLPNTEKWFDKWKDLFFTMLIFFPAFSLVFGGSQLAGQIIIQNAGDSIVMVLFGMAVQVAPLVITPLLLRFSGSLLGRIAQIANNPRKGIMDRTDNWAERRAEHAKQQNIAKGPRLRNPASWGAGMVRGLDNRRRNLKERTDMYTQQADNRYRETKKYRGINEQMAGVEMDKQSIEQRNNAHIQGRVADRRSPLHTKAVTLEDAKVQAERAGAQSAETLSGYRAGTYNTGGDARLGQLQRRMAENVIETAAWKQGEQNNQYVMQRGISERMRVDEKLQTIAQGYGSDELKLVGKERAQASAVATLSKLNADARQNTITLMETEAVEHKKSVKDYAIENVFRNAASSDSALRASVSKNQLEAALEIAASDGQVTVFDDARASRYIDQDTVDAVVARHVPDMKSKGGFHIQAKPKLSLQRYIEDFNKGDTSHGSTLEEVESSFTLDLNKARLESLADTTSANLGNVKAGAFEKLAKDIEGNNLLDVIQPGADGRLSAKDQATVEKLFESLREGLSDPSTRATMTDRLAYARNMEEAVRSKFFPTAPPLRLNDDERAVPGGGTRPDTVAEGGPIPTPAANPTAGAPNEAEPPFGR